MRVYMCICQMCICQMCICINITVNSIHIYSYGNILATFGPKIKTMMAILTINLPALDLSDRRSDFGNSCFQFPDN